jgi:hypothetical protein
MRKHKKSSNVLRTTTRGMSVFYHSHASKRGVLQISLFFEQWAMSCRFREACLWRYEANERRVENRTRTKSLMSTTRCQYSHLQRCQNLPVLHSSTRNVGTFQYDTNTLLKHPLTSSTQAMLRHHIQRPPIFHRRCSPTP